jgi:hypothetical protein
MTKLAKSMRAVGYAETGDAGVLKSIQLPIREPGTRSGMMDHGR